MKIPTWAYIVGICMILVGSCSITNNYSTLKIKDEFTKFENGEDTTIEFNVDDGEVESIEVEGDSSKTSLFESMRELDSIEQVNKENRGDTAITNANNKVAAEKIKEMLNVSDETMDLMILFSKFGIGIGVLYIIAGIMLFIKKPYSFKITLGVLIFSIAFTAIKMYMMMGDDDFNVMSVSTLISGGFGVFVDAVFLLIVGVSDKLAYTFTGYDDE